MSDVFLADYDAIICERDCATYWMNYWKNMAFVARIEREEARQVARRMKAERDNARAMYEVLKRVLEQ